MSVTPCGSSRVGKPRREINYRDFQAARAFSLSSTMLFGGKIYMKLGFTLRILLLTGTLFRGSVMEFGSSASPARVIAVPLEATDRIPSISILSASGVGDGFTNFRKISPVLLLRVALPCTPVSAGLTGKISSPVFR